jgi:hypothetical protein
MLTLYPHQELGHFQNEWLDSRHHFSFGHYYNPKRMGFGPLRVINDDLIAKNKGFEPHPHKNMEIITYVRQGTIHHRDSLGNEGATKAGQIQVMTAGTGIIHSEFSDVKEDTKIFQIWIEPRQKDLTPSWDTMEVLSHDSGHTSATSPLRLLASGRAEHFDAIYQASDDKGSVLYFNQDAHISVLNLQKDENFEYELGHRLLYAVVAKGSFLLNGKKMTEGDGAEIHQEQKLYISSLDKSELLLIEI